MTPQRRKGPRAKQAQRPTRGPREGSKPTKARSPLAGRHTTPSTARPSAVLPAKPGVAAVRPAAAAPAPLPALAPPATLAALPPAEPTLLQRAERLRDDIIRSKLTHPDPWSYTAKARAWGQQVQTLVEEIAAAGQTPTLHEAVAEFSAEVESDPDFQAARQVF